MPGKRSPGIPARGFFNTKLEDIAEVCPFGAKLSAARREKCCGGRAGTGLGGRILPRSPVLAAASFPGDRFRRPRPSPGARSRRPRPSPEPGFGGRVLSGDRLPPCSAFRSRSAGLPLPDGEGRGRVPLPCPFRAAPRRTGDRRGTDGGQTGDRRGTDGDGRRRRFPDGTAQRRFRRGSCRAAGSVSQRSGPYASSRCALSPIRPYGSLSGTPFF